MIVRLSVAPNMCRINWIVLHSTISVHILHNDQKLLRNANYCSHWHCAVESGDRVLLLALAKGLM